MTTAIHASRAVVSAGMLLPGRSRWRGVASTFLALSGAAVYARHRYGTDGSDQVSVLVQSGNALARLSRSPAVQDAVIWHTAIQSNLSYAVSGWFKLISSTWRDGTALRNVMRTRTYGHEPAFTLADRYPKAAKVLVHSVLVLECGFPLIYAFRGRLAAPVIVSAAAFHGANGFLLGLGRFLSSFTSMHPYVAYTTAPKDHPAVAGRDDRTVPAVLAALCAAAASAGIAAAQRRARVLEGTPDTRRITTASGNTLAYQLHDGGPDKPVVVLVPGLASMPEQFAWITATLRDESHLGIVTYDRAGYGASVRGRGAAQDLQSLAADLAELARSSAPGDRKVVLVGHSLGGDLARRAAGLLEDRLAGIVYLDAAHPGELQRSKRQRDAAERFHQLLAVMDWSNRVGAGAIMTRPLWLESLPFQARRRAMWQYADARMWCAARREWAAVKDDYARFSGELAPVNSPALVLSAQQTVDSDPEQLLMHNEIAQAHRTAGAPAESLVLEGANHDSIMTNGTYATLVARRILAFLDDTAAPSAANAAGRKEAST
ncbi:alpha/beta fold hydrolase [Streptomyces nigrescens]